MSSEGLHVALYGKLLRLRTDYHRLTPDRRLSSLKQAKVFIEEVGMATLTPGKELPSLFGAVQGRPYKPWSRGFGAYPAEECGGVGLLLSPRVFFMSRFFQVRGSS